MGKVVGSYASVVRGVSEQIPSDRLPGQFSEMVNMVDDPVRGKARRHGSALVDERLLMPGTLTDTQKEYLRNYRAYDFFLGGIEYSLIFQSQPRAHGDTLPLIQCVNKATGQFLTVNLSESAAGALDPWKDGGISAVALVGRFLVLASNQLGPGYATTDKFAATQEWGVAWVRGGAYSRTYKLVIRGAPGSYPGSPVYTATYTTMASSYPSLLDTSDIAQSDPEYQKKVNDRVNAYNSAVNKWVGDALASTQPQNIAAQLAAQLTAAGYVNLAVVGGSIFMDRIADMTCDDSGDGTLFRAVFNEVDDPAKLSTVHGDQKVVRVKPRGTDEVYYMRAVKTDTAMNHFGPVQWVEGPAQVVTPGQVFALAHVTSTSITLANSPAQLAAAIGSAVPGYAPSVCGDLMDAGAVPYFFGRKVSHMTMFQDRLCIVSNGVILMSRTGDYFNWFRKSKLRVDDDDPIEAFALGSEDDIISQSSTYNKDLVFFGERGQYALPGRSAITPKTVSITQVAGERDAMLARPIPVGNLLFYGKYETKLDQTGPSKFAASLSQFQLGLFQDTPETYNASQQLDAYLRGRIIELASLPKPYTVFCRTDGLDNGLYTYRFIDQQGTQARQFDSWSRWEWDERVGTIVGLTTYKATLYVYVVRINAAGVWIGAENFIMDSSTAVSSYLDSQRSGAQYDAATSTTKFIAPDNPPDEKAQQYMGGKRPYPTAYLGGAVTNYADLRANVFGGDNTKYDVGFQFQSYTDLTPPYVRDRNDKAIVSGRLVVNRYTVSVTDTAGMDSYLTAQNQTTNVQRFSGRRVGISNNQVGIQPYSTAVVDVPAGRANTEHSMRLQSRTWLPMTISSIEWVGQLFINSRRV
ncbi:tail tubular protein A [Ralstonia phage BHDT_So9]|uniref:Tail tubular protein A n=1 Tax=Ralstonia phage BHDT_So9 TaxID=2972464 RepID=A0A9E7QWS8_9CAUD|nr:tail tubular protein A [Ralstonia phage BHDT_So9]UWI83513.1 tail tubular protein B [Ralstonia phage DLDT_So2]UZT26901.1 tail tubular protein B [Ralstonia phage BHDTSo81]WEM03429.1 non-contractile tail tubular protein [Ralstonia phage BHDT8]